MKVLSLFDGISCARVALERAGIPVEEYYASEIDKYAMQISAKNYPYTVQLGSVTEIFAGMFQSYTKLDIEREKRNGGFLYTESLGIDLMIGGSPCQDLSIAKKNRKGLSGERSGLFWEYVRILNEVKPKYFILENVNSMPKEAKQVITKALGVEPVMIDAALVSAQRRKRLFWVGKWNGKKYEQVMIPQPEDRGIFLKDILEDGEGIKYNRKDGAKEKLDKAGTLSASDWRGLNRNQDQTAVYQYRRTYWRETKGGKVPTLTANMGTGGNNVPYIQGAASRTWPRIPNGKTRSKRIELNGIPKANSMTLVQGDSMVAVPYIQQTARGYNKGGKKFGKVPTLSTSAWEHNHKLNGIRKLTPVECERLQSLPDNYTEGVSNTQRYRSLGNAFNVEVVAHIIRNLK